MPELNRDVSPIKRRSIQEQIILNPRRALIGLFGGLLGIYCLIYDTGNLGLLGVVGVLFAGMFVFTICYLGKMKQRSLVHQGMLERRGRFPGEPWKWPIEWQASYIDADNARFPAFLWMCAALLMAGGCIGLGIYGTDERATRVPSQAVAALVFGSGLTGWAIYMSIRQRKYGRVRFVPATSPGVVGGYLGGVIDVPTSALANATVQLHLRCVRRETRGRGKGRHTINRILWRYEESVAPGRLESTHGGTKIPVLVSIPADCQSSEWSDRNNEIVWWLSAKAAVPGVDFSVRFTVPVFDTKKSSAPTTA